VPRCKENVPASITGSFGNVPIKTYKNPKTPGLRQITVRRSSLSPEETSRSLMRGMKLDSLWMAGCTMEILSRPSWAGFMEEATKTSGLYAVSFVHALPFINLDPTKPSAIYSALMFAADKCEKNDKAWCIVTLIRSAIVSKSFRNCCCITNKPWECDGEDRWFPPVDILYKCSWQHHVRHWTGGTAEQVICSVVCTPHGFRPRILPSTQG